MTGVLLERADAVGVFHRAIREAGGESGAVVLIESAAGAGGSALLRRLGALAVDAGLIVLNACGAHSERNFPFGVLRQLAMRMPGRSGCVTLPARVREVLDPLSAVSALQPPPDHGSVAFADLMHDLHVMFSGFTKTAVVLVDDLHWADELSLRALAFLAARLRGTRLLIGVVVADGAVARLSLLDEIVQFSEYRVRAEALSIEATGEFVGARFRSGCDPGFVESCHQVTEGRPRDLSILLSRASARRLSGVAGDREQVQLLGSVLRQERLVRLFQRDPGVEAFGRAVVVLGARARVDLATRLSGVSWAECAVALAAMDGTWLTVTEAGKVVPDSVLVRTVEELMPGETAATIHRAAAKLLTEQGLTAEDVVDHLMQAATLRDEREFTHLRSAAAAARRRGASEAAARYSSYALLNLKADDAGHGRLLVELAMAELDFAPRAAVRHLAQAASLLPDARDRAAALSRVPVTLAAEVPRVRALVQEVAGQLGSADTLTGYERELALQLEARSRYANLDGLGHLDEAVARLGELSGNGYESSVAGRELRSVLLLTGTLTGRLDAEETARHAEAILDLQPAYADEAWSVLCAVPIVLAVAERGDLVAPWLAEAEKHCAPGDRATQAVVGAQQAMIHYARGELVAARACAVRAFEVADPSWPDSLSLAAMALGKVGIALRDSTLLTSVLERTTDMDGLVTLAVRRMLRGILLVGSGDTEAALAQFLDCGRHLDRAGWRHPGLHRWWAAAVPLFVEMGRLDEADRLASESYERALAWGSPGLIGRALRVRACAVDQERAILFLREAVELLEAAQNGFELAKACIDLADHLRESEPLEAEVLFMRGHRLAVRSGADWLADLSSGLLQPHEGSEPSIRPPELTPAETTVATLAANGRTNSEIAGELQVSVRAIEKHLSNSYRKLRIKGRPGLADALRLEIGLH